MVLGVFAYEAEWDTTITQTGHSAEMRSIGGVNMLKIFIWNHSLRRVVSIQEQDKHQKH